MATDLQALSPVWWLLAGILGTLACVAAWRAWRHRRDANPRTPARRRTGDRTTPAGADPVRAAPPASPSGLVGWSPVAEAATPAAAGARVTDPLTGLATRLMLEDQLASAVLRAEARQRRLALLYIDIDGFKPVNDSFGHGVGDALLREAASRLAEHGRSTDTVARLGADEFLVLLDGDPDAGAAALVAERVRASLERPYQLSGREVRVSCSVGIVLYPDHGPRARLIARADAAMLAAKRAGGNMHCFYAPGMDHDAEAAVELQRDLRTALETGQGLSLHYQPKIDSASGQIAGVEALLRWQHPQRGAVSPVTFIPVAERFGLIGALGQWVIDEAARQIKAWRAVGLSMRVAINVSVHQLRQPDLAERVGEILARHGVPPDLITFELTESAAMEDPSATLRIFERLAVTGVALSIDDFGTGYSSLSYLRKLPASQIKIDRSFVQDLGSQSDARAIVKAVIKLSHALGLEVVAEGVETVAQQDILKQLGCDQMQGYLFARPMPASHLQLWALSDELPANRPTFRDSAFNPDEIDPPSRPLPGRAMR